MSLFEKSCLLLAIAGISLSIGCGSHETTVIQPTETFQPTAEQAEFEQEVQKMREDRSSIDP